MAAPGAVSLGVFLWVRLGRPSIEGRIHAISIGAGIIALMVVRALWPLAKPYLIDRVLFWVAELMAANLIVRPIVILSLVGGFDNYRSEEHTSELQSLMRISYAVCFLKKKQLKDVVQIST